MSRRPPDVHVGAAVFVGGVAGTLARAGLAEAFPIHPGAWPWGTFLANLMGATLLGWATVRLRGRELDRSLVATGVCGALTTFSTFQLELYLLLDGGDVALAAGYALASVAGGLALAVGARRWATA